jgi:RNA polymerase sigma-70 factor, ECF subfamily
MSQDRCAAASTWITDGLSKAEFSRLVEAEIPYLRRIVRRWQRDAANAADLVQDTLVRALANGHLWQPGTNMRAWLIVIMRNHFLASLARSSRSSQADATFAAANPDLAPDGMDARLMLRDVASVLARLPVKQRSALLLVGVEGQSYEEVAAAMGTSVGAIRCDLARARARLRTAIDRSDAAPPLAAHAVRPAQATVRRPPLPRAPLPVHAVAQA